MVLEIPDCLMDGVDDAFEVFVDFLMAEVKDRDPKVFEMGIPDRVAFG